MVHCQVPIRGVVQALRSEPGGPCPMLAHLGMGAVRHGLCALVPRRSSAKDSASMHPLENLPARITKPHEGCKQATGGCVSPAGITRHKPTDASAPPRRDCGHGSAAPATRDERDCAIMTRRPWAWGPGDMGRTALWYYHPPAVGLRPRRHPKRDGRPAVRRPCTWGPGDMGRTALWYCHPPAVAPRPRPPYAAGTGSVLNVPTTSATRVAPNSASAPGRASRISMAAVGR